MKFVNVFCCADFLIYSISVAEKYKMNHPSCKQLLEKNSKGHISKYLSWFFSIKILQFFNIWYTNTSYKHVKAICCMYSSLLTDGPADVASYRVTSPLIGSCIV